MKKNIINTENLKKMSEYIKTIPQDRFDMELYRYSEDKGEDPECESVGCVIGHCTILDLPENLVRSDNGTIIYNSWCKQFIGLGDSTDSVLYHEIFSWLFDSNWKNVDNTPIGAGLRIDWYLEHGIPKNHREQLRGDEELCYTSNYFDCNGVLLTSRSVIDLKQTVNGRSEVYVGSLRPLVLYYNDENDKGHVYHYDSKDLLSKCKLTGEVDWEIISKGETRYI